MESDTKVTVRRFLKCPSCGHNVVRALFTRGALGHSFQALTQTLVGKGKGRDKRGELGRGGQIWTRRPMNRQELEHVGAALATAIETLQTLLEGNLPEARPPELVIAEIEDDDEADEVASGWIEEAALELERRQRNVEAAFARRELNK